MLLVRFRFSRVLSFKDYVVVATQLLGRGLLADPNLNIVNWAKIIKMKPVIRWKIVHLQAYICSN